MLAYSADLRDGVRCDCDTGAATHSVQQRSRRGTRLSNLAGAAGGGAGQRRHPHPQGGDERPPGVAKRGIYPDYQPACGPQLKRIRPVFNQAKHHDAPTRG